MRLLHSTTLELHEFQDGFVPEYAILSHFWDVEEVSFQEVRLLSYRRSFNTFLDLAAEQSTILERQGWRKIQGAAALAAKQGFHYIWVDTCCIDKRSSAELSEAINSMYRWYKDAGVCYAYLADVDSSPLEDYLFFGSSFASSRWFTRGWTLQELVAPNSVEFYSRECSFLGEKCDEKLLNSIANITGINETVLDGSQGPEDISISVRMNWASKRKTTRVEDLAYCLMGIFDVNMPLLYGEGEKAFIRLQEEILKNTDDQSIFAWYTEGMVPDTERLYGLLADSAACFPRTESFRPLPPLLSEGSFPSSITNQGVQVRLYLQPREDEDGKQIAGEYQVIIDCTTLFTGEDFSPMLYLRKLWGDQYARIDPSHCGLTRTSSSRGKGTYKKVFVKQKPKYFLPKFKVAKDNIPGLLDSSKNSITSNVEAFILTAVYPVQQWDKQNLSLETSYSQLNNFSGIFRFENSRFPNHILDVVVGIRQEADRRSWRSWALQLHSTRDKPSRLWEQTGQNNGMSVIDFDENWFKPIQRARLNLICIASSSNQGLTEHLQEDEDGDDSFTKTFVEELQQHGRKYYSITVRIKPELSAEPMVTLALPDPSGSAALEYELQTGISSRLERLFESIVFQSQSSDEWTYQISPPDQLKGVRIRSKDPRETFRLYLDSNDSNTTMNIRGMELLLACKEGNLGQVLNQLLMKTPAGLEAEDPSIQTGGFRPFHWAAVSGDLTIVHKLMDAGVDITARTEKGWTALHLAALMNYPKIAAGIPRSAQKKNISKRTLLHHSHNALGDTVLHLAASAARRVEDCEIWRYIPMAVNEDDDPSWRCFNSLGETPLHRAAAMDNQNAVNMILRQVPYMTVEAEFVGKGLLPYQDLDRNGRSTLWHAACGGSAGIISRLVQAGALVDLADENGMTPLHAACRVGNASAADALLKAGANYNIKTNAPELTPAHFAAMYGFGNCLIKLLKSGAIINDGTGETSVLFTPLHLASANGNVSCLKILCEFGADLRLRSTHHIYHTPEDDSQLVKHDGDAESIARLYVMQTSDAQKSKYQDILSYLNLFKQNSVV